MTMKIILAAFAFSMTSMALAAPQKLLCSIPTDNANYTVNLNVYNDGQNDFAAVLASYSSQPLFYKMDEIQNGSEKVIVLENRSIFLTVDQKRILHFTADGRIALEVFWISVGLPGYTSGTSGSQLYGCEVL